MFWGGRCFGRVDVLVRERGGRCFGVGSMFWGVDVLGRGRCLLGEVSMSAWGVDVCLGGGRCLLGRGSMSAWERGGRCLLGGGRCLLGEGEGADVCLGEGEGVDVCLGEGGGGVSMSAWGGVDVCLGEGSMSAWGRGRCLLGRGVDVCLGVGGRCLLGGRCMGVDVGWILGRFGSIPGRFRGRVGVSSNQFYTRFSFTQDLALHKI